MSCMHYHNCLELVRIVQNVLSISYVINITINQNNRRLHPKPNYDFRNTLIVNDSNVCL